MKSKTSFTQPEIDSAWILWQALLAHLEALWARYEEPFSERMKQGWEAEQSWCDEFSDDDIPF